MKSLDGKEVDLSKYQGKVVMVVNVASKCGLTPQYKQLQALHEKYEKDGLVILGFPCNQFRQQEPGTAEEIQRVLHGQLRRDLPVVRQDRGQRRRGLPALQAPDGPGHQAHGHGEDQLELREVHHRPQRRGRRPLRPTTKPDAPEVLKVIEAELAKK